MPHSQTGTEGDAREASGSRVPTVRAVERTARLLEALLGHPRGLRLAELSARLDLHKTTVLRLLRTLVAMRVVRRDESTERYYWEPLRWLSIAENLESGQSTQRAVRALLSELAEATGQTAILSTLGLQRGTLFVVSCALPSTPIRLDVTQHSRMAPLHRVAGGHVQLAYLPDGEAESLLAELAAGAELAELRAALPGIRARGYAVTKSGHIRGAGALAVPVQDSQGKIVASLDLAGPEERFTEQNLQAWLPLLQETAPRFSRLISGGSIAEGE